MTNGENHYVLVIEAIERKIRSAAKLDSPLPEFDRQFLYRPPHLRMAFEQLQSLSNRLYGLAGRILRRPLQAWRSGASASSPASCLASHSSAAAEDLRRHGLQLSMKKLIPDRRPPNTSLCLTQLAHNSPQNHPESPIFRAVWRVFTPRQGSKSPPFISPSHVDFAPKFLSPEIHPLYVDD